jgi:hypothetical protein
LFGKTGVFLHPIAQAICFKKPVQSLNSCQTIVWHFTDIEKTIFKKIDCGSKKFVKHLTAKIKKKF